MSGAPFRRGWTPVLRCTIVRNNGYQSSSLQSYDEYYKNLTINRDKDYLSQHTIGEVVDLHRESLQHGRTTIPVIRCVRSHPSLGSHLSLDVLLGHGGKWLLDVEGRSATLYYRKR